MSLGYISPQAVSSVPGLRSIRGLKQAHLARDAVERLEEEEDEGEGDVLVEGVLDQAPQPVVRQRAMHQQQPHQKPAAHEPSEY